MILLIDTDIFLRAALFPAGEAAAALKKALAAPFRPQVRETVVEELRRLLAELCPQAREETEAFLSVLTETVTVLQMDDGGSVLDRQEYEAGRAPERVVPVNGAAYLIVETRSAGGAAARQLVQPGDESFTTLFDRGDGACGQVLTEVGWPGM